LPGSHLTNIYLDQPEAGVMCHPGSGQQLALPVPMNDTDFCIVIGLMESAQQAQRGTADAWKMRPDRPSINRNVHAATAERALSPER
jgi:hypothetical protein